MVAPPEKRFPSWAPVARGVPRTGGYSQLCMRGSMCECVCVCVCVCACLLVLVHVLVYASVNSTYTIHVSKFSQECMCVLGGLHA
jgi:hypothetical protein